MPVKFSENTPDWVRDWVNWAVQQLVPDWDVTVLIVEKLSEFNKQEMELYENPDEILAHSNPSNDSLFTRIELLSNLKDDEEGHLVVVHEVCHAFTAYMAQMAENLITSKAIKRSAWKSFSNAEEQTVVRLSRILVAFRDKIMLNSKDGVSLSKES